MRLLGVWLLFLAPAIAAFLPREARKTGWIFVLLFELMVSFFLLA